MNWFITLFSSTLGKKLIMALTGLFLISFLVVHLAGNFQLLHSDDGRAFNIYAYFMTHNPVIKTISYLLYTSILVHALWGLLLSIKNRRSRGPQGYSKKNASSPWTSRNMGILGTLIFIFIVIHMQQFWAQMHWGDIDIVTYDGVEYKNLYITVAQAFAEAWYVALYVISMAALAFHLWHGFASAFQTLGLNHLKYNAVIKFVGSAFAIIVPALFAWIPIQMFFLQ
ncbi:MAG: succinate dehydrogenase cytochrome b subunit [Bacteroidia bacterium]|nr:succinate dehydrogenase cytochrome b subunit [Bacteroidia bacterium]